MTTFNGYEKLLKAEVNHAQLKNTVKARKVSHSSKHKRGTTPWWLTKQQKTLQHTIYISEKGEGHTQKAESS